MSDAGPMVVRKAPIWMKVLLALSLAANFAVIGVLGGIAYKVFPVVQEGPPGGGRGGIVPFVAALEPDQRRALGLKLRDEFRAAGPRVDMRQLVVIVETEPFDRRAAWTIIETHGQTTQQRVEITKQLLIDHLATISPEERAAYAERLRERLERRQRKSDSKSDKRY